NLSLTGDGVTVAVIDTGVDYDHKDFGGLGAAAYADNDPAVIELGSFPTAKVIGGYDFAGTSYDASGYLGPATPTPDPDPLDVHGHGTHVAGSAAGEGVLSNGTTFTGPYGPDAYAANTFEIGPGVAPEALIYAYKVFGDQAGSTNLTSLAIDRALDPNQDGSIDDHVDVINMSLGAPFGSPNDPSAIASKNASRLGVVVVASAGNEGDIPYVTGAPAVAPGAISVAASFDDGYVMSAIKVNSPSSLAGFKGAVEGAITKPLSVTGDVTADVAAADPYDGCGSLINATEIDGKIALIERGTCWFSTKILNAQAAGAVAVIVVNNRPGLPAVMGGNSAGITIPGVMISDIDGAALKEALDLGTPVNVTLSATYILPRPELADTLASFTSRGPGVTNLFKPDVAAPGFGIRSAAVGTGTLGVTYSGTSMASPHVAGLAALVVQQHPDWSPAQVKALIQNGTVVGHDEGGAAYPLTRQGVGVVRADRTLGLGSMAMPGGVSFGYLDPTRRDRKTEKVTITNFGNATKTYSITVTPNQTVSGVTVSAPSSVRVRPGKTRRIEVEITLDPAAMPADFGFYSQTEVDGWLTLTSGTEEIRVGYLAVIDPAAKFNVHGAGSDSITITNDSQTIGFAEGFTLAEQGGLLLDKTPFAIDATGYRTNVFGPYDVVQFGVSMDKAWSAPSEGEVDIYLDTNQDGSYDYVLVAADLGFFFGGDPTGQVVTALFDLVHGGGFLEWYVDADYNDRVMMLTTDRTVGRGWPYDEPFGFLAPDDTTFDYQMVVFGRAGSVDVQIGSIDLANEVVPSDGSFGLLPGGETTVDLTPASGTMVWFFPNNEEENQVKIVELGDNCETGRMDMGRDNDHWRR
ncbi:MAG: S8 family serine peptidase, partial [Gammaproteobacteria bacterium]|nr:S8 family serine peptidase [Gammaproteobacteria bacterium]